MLPFYEMKFSAVWAGLRAWEPAAEPCPDGPRDSWVDPVPVLAIRVFSFADGKVASGIGCASQGRLGPVRGQCASCTWPVASATGRAVSPTPLGTAPGAVLPDASPARGARLVQCAGHSPSVRLGLSCQVDPLQRLQLSECSTEDDFTRPSRCIPVCSLLALGVMVLQGRGGQVQPRWPLEEQWESEVVLPCCGGWGTGSPWAGGRALGSPIHHGENRPLQGLPAARTSSLDCAGVRPQAARPRQAGRQAGR